MLVLFLITKVLLIGIFGPVGNTEPVRPYYIRRSPVILVSQPLDGNLGCEDFVSLTCEVMGMEPIISGWWPNIYWRHNGSIVNSTWPGNVTIDTNYWNMTTLHSSFPATYQCIVDDGSFILASRLATVKEVKCVGGIEESEVPQRSFKFRMLCGYGASAYSWYKDGIPLNSSTYLVEENGRIVAVTNETGDSSGLYTCITSDVIRQWYLPPQASRETTTVLIDGNPYNVFVSHSGYGLTVEDITLQCNIMVNGSAVNVTWFHNGELHSRSAGSLNFFKNSNVSAIAGTYVCTASRSTWEVRVQFRILLKHKPNPPDSVKSRCIDEYQEINAQNLHLSWASPLWNNLVNGIDIYDPSDSFLELMISRHKHPNERYYHRLAPNFASRNPQTLRLDSAYCITLIAFANSLFQPYFLSEGNSTLHRCNEPVHSCSQVRDVTDHSKFTLSSDDALSINCGELQSDEKYECLFMWVQPTNHRAYTAKAFLNLTCPNGYSNQQTLTHRNFVDLDRVIRANVKFPALNCQLECQVNICIKFRTEDCVYSRSGHLTSHSRKLAKPGISCTAFKGKSNITILTPQDDRIQMCLQSDTSNNNSKTVIVYANGDKFQYSTQLNDTLEIPIEGNHTVIAMYSIPATGTSLNSTEINIPDNCSCIAGWTGSQCAQDIDECSQGKDNCAEICTNTDGSFACGCFLGYTLDADGFSCSDIDECSQGKDNCDQLCTNTDGSFVCGCFPGYTLDADGFSCSDTDECSQGKDNCDQLCTNTVGSFACGCFPGYTLDADVFSCSVSPTNNDAVISGVTVGLVLLIFILGVIGLCLCCRCRRNYYTEPPVYFEPEKFVELTSVAECDMPTVCDDVCEDIEKWIQDVSQEEDPAISKTSNEVYPGYIEGIKVAL